PETRFVFIGIPGFYSSVVDEFARYDDERIVDIERASGSEKSAALDACDVFAMPSLHETFGIGYLEAWLHERPVVGGDIPPLREARGAMRVVIAKKLLSTVGGSEAQARALAKALHDRHHEVTLVGLRPAWRRPGIGKDVVNGPSGPVERHEDGVRYLFIPVRG